MFSWNVYFSTRVFGFLCTLMMLWCEQTKITQTSLLLHSPLGPVNHKSKQDGRLQELDRLFNRQVYPWNSLTSCRLATLAVSSCCSLVCVNIVGALKDCTSNRTTVCLCVFRCLKSRFLLLSHLVLFPTFHTVCAVSVCGANAEIKFTIPLGKLFTYELMRETFQNDFEPLSKLYGKILIHVYTPTFDL